MSSLVITCLCGAVRRDVQPIENQNVEICHCFGCRHSSGQLYSSYCEVSSSEAETIESDPVFSKYALPASEATASVALYFCSTCGCHVFRVTTASDSTTVEVATGTIVSRKGESDADVSTVAVGFGRQINANSTVDGGISIWMPSAASSNERTSHGLQKPPLASQADALGTKNNCIPASCHCGGLQFRVSPPNKDSSTPHSGLPDLMVPFRTGHPDIKNTRDEKWWLRQNNTKYMAGLCACKSCRLASGFEIQSWAFIPRLNIEYCLGSAKDGTIGGSWLTLDFEALRKAGVLKSYNSSPGVLREFCPKCGATAFWHDQWRSELIDVSVGLLDSTDGVRAESMLEWWTERVSFAEDATLDRSGYWAMRSNKLVQNLEKCMMQNLKSTGS